MPDSNVIILGGGAIGLSTAYFMNRSGFDVTVIDANELNSDIICSWGNSGMIVPSHIVPLAAPGVIKQGLKWLLDAESPFSIEFKPSIEMISWLWKFRKAANPGHVRAGAKLLQELGLRSRSLYLDIGDKIDIGLETNGILMLCNSELAIEDELKVSKMARDLGMNAVDLDQSGVQKLETGMTTNVIGGVHYPLDCNIDPILFMDLMQKYLIQKGVKFYYNKPVTELIINEDKIESVKSNNESWSADYIVLSAGSFSSKLIKKIGLKMPLMGGKGYSYTLESPQKKPSIPAILIEARIASTPMGSKWRFGGTMTVTDSNRSINQRKLLAMARFVKNYYPEYDSSWVHGCDPWVGLRPLSADGIPYIGSFKKFPNLIAATGHAMMGISMAPVTGEIVNNLILGKKPNFNLDMLSPDRF